MNARSTVSATLCAIAAGCLMAADAYADSGDATTVPEDTVPAAAPAHADRFTLVGVTIDGAHALSATALSSAYSGYLLQTVSDDDLARIADAITGRYRRSGYFLSRAIVTGDEAGIAHIAVLEGRISEIIVRGDGADLVQHYMRGFDTQRPAQLHDLDHRLALASGVPGLVLQSHIEPNVNDPTQHRLIIDTSLHHSGGYAVIDNRGAKDEGPVRAYGRVSLNSTLTRGDEFAVGAFGSLLQPDELVGGELRYERGGAGALRYSIGVSASRAHDGPDPLSADIGGEREQAVIRLEYPLIRTRNQGLWASAQFDANQIAYDWLGGGGYNDNTRELRAGLRGFLNDEGQATTIFIETSMGLDVLGASHASLARRSRLDADGQFTALDFRFTHYRDIGAHFGIFFSLSGQWSDDALLLSEQFQLGGASYGRAFAYGELSGDKGIAASVEVRAGFDPNMKPITFVQGYAFVDAGHVWNVGSGGGEDSLASSGVGVRLTLADRVRAGFELAHPLDLSINDPHEQDWRPSFSVSAQY